MNGFQNDPAGTAVRYALGFVGAGALIMLLPKTLKFLVRRFFFGMAAEVVTIVLAGLLTEKLVDQISQD